MTSLLDIIVALKHYKLYHSLNYLVFLALSRLRFCSVQK